MSSEGNYEAVLTSLRILAFGRAAEQPHAQPTVPRLQVRARGPELAQIKATQALAKESRHSNAALGGAAVPPRDAQRPSLAALPTAEHDGCVGTVPGLGPPVFALKNTATRWATTVNYDLLIYQDTMVVARGLSWKGFTEEQFESRAIGLKPTSFERDEHRLTLTSETPLEELLTADSGNRLIRTADIASAKLGRRFGICTLRLTLQGGESLKYMWMNSSKATKYEPAKVALRELLGAKLTV